MARAATKNVTPAAAPDLLPAVKERMEIGQELATAQQKAVTELARTLNYQGSTDPAVLENSVKDAIRRIGTALFELGGYLLLLKEACGHGKFLPALERVGLEPRAAQRYMSMVRRFANTSTSTHLEGRDASKLVELLPLDDEQIEELNDLGQTGELALDDVARMSVKELRAAVRKTRDEKKRMQNVNEELNSENAQLKADAKLIAKLPVAEQLIQVQQQATAIMNDALGAVRGGVRQALLALQGAPAEAGDQAVFMAGIVGQLQAELSAMRDEFNLPDVSNAADLKLMVESAEWAAPTVRKAA